MTLPGMKPRSLDKEIIEHSFLEYENIRFREIMACSEDEKILKAVKELKGATDFKKYLIAQFTS